MKFIQNNSYLLFIVTLCVTFSLIGINKLENEIIYDKITVAEGDTLWAYSMQYAKKMPTDIWIEETIRLNNLSSATIKVGEELRLPGGKKVNRNDTTTQIAGDDGE